MHIPGARNPRKTNKSLRERPRDSLWTEEKPSFGSPILSCEFRILAVTKDETQVRISTPPHQNPLQHPSIFVPRDGAEHKSSHLK